MKRLWPKVATLTFLLALIAPLTAQADDVNSGERVNQEAKLAVEIVNRFRQLRSSCHDQQNEAKEMCYYRLRIGIWDYQQAMDTLRDKGIRVQDQRQLATVP